MIKRTAIVTITAYNVSNSAVIQKTIEVSQSAADPTILTVSPTSHSVTANGTTVYSTISSNANWTAVSNASWLTINPASGTGNGMVRFVVATNTTQISRMATVTITAGSITQNVIITQEALAYRVFYDANGGTFTPTDNNTYLEGATVNTAGTITKTGYTFTGWKRSDNGVIIAAGSSFTMPASNLTLTAQWQINKSSFKGTVTNCTNIRVIGGGRFIYQADAVYGEYTAITAKFANTTLMGSKFIQNTDGSVTVTAGTYKVRLVGNFCHAGWAGIYIASVRDLYYRSSYSGTVTAAASGSVDSSVVINDTFSEVRVTVPINTTIRCDAQIVGRNRPWGWTTGTYTVSSMEITEL